MLKHQPFGWIKSKTDGHYSMVTAVDAVEDMKSIAISGDHIWSFDEIMISDTFADGAPFGIVIKEKLKMKLRLTKKLAHTLIQQ